MTQYLFDTHDKHILGFNQHVLDTYPHRFRIAAQDEVDAHFGARDKKLKSSDMFDGPNAPKPEPTEPSSEMQAALKRKQEIADKTRERIRKMNEARAAKKAVVQLA